jgi:hypothetical protein
MRGRKPEFQPDFPPEFVEGAHRIARRRKVPHRLWQRARLVELLDEDPRMRNPHAAEKVGLHPNSVRNWRRRWTGGDFSLEDRERSGRPREYEYP